MLPLEEARALVLARCAPRPGATVALDDALGCVLTAAVTAAEAVPPFDNSAVDGYAVRAADTVDATTDRPCRLAVVATIAAGDAPDRPVGPGQAVRIMTGAPLPEGADALVMVEDTDRDGDEGVLVRSATSVGRHVRRAGDDVQPGDEVLPAGTVLGPAHLGVLASLGRTEVQAVPRLRVGVLSTGDELVEGGGPLRPGQIRESNRPMLRALVQRAGFEPVDLGLVPDDPAVLEQVLRDGAERCDALVSSGGVSMGDFDVVKQVLDRVADMAWMQVAIKPAKPFAFGVLEGVPVFGLPGNPVSSLVSFELLAAPGLRRLAGHTALSRPVLPAAAPDGLPRRPDGKLHLVRVRLRSGPDGLAARPVGAQGSHQLAATAGADGLAVVPDGDGIAAGGRVLVLLLGADPLPGADTPLRSADPGSGGDAVPGDDASGNP